MPFDSSSIINTPASKILRESLDLLGPNGEYWIKGKMATRRGVCSMGSVAKVFDLHGSRRDGIPISDRYKAMESLYKAIPKNYEFSISEWNDDPVRTFQDVQRVFERAIEIANKGE